MKGKRGAAGCLHPGPLCSYGKRSPDQALAPPSGNYPRWRCAYQGYKKRSPDQALAPPSGNYPRWRCAYQGYRKRSPDQA
ncbi:MAG: hypothetical protein E6470_16885, partial [Enterobacteriaceae bacterium]|nr:hypothetical protein [Enterobacteriaceae bacterium]